VRKLLVFFCLFSAFTAVSSAGITASLDGGAPTAAGAGLYRYTYTATLGSNVLEAGDYFVIYDFFGYHPESITAPNVNWTTDDTATIGPYPGVPTADSPALVNLLWVYEGVSISAMGGPFALGKFSAVSSSNRIGVLSLAGITDGGNLDFFDTAPGPIPEPSTTGLLAAGLAALWYGRRRRAH